jgi:replication factor A1
MRESIMKISELKEGMRRVSLTATVTEISEPREVVTKFGNSRVATAIISDDSGKMKLTLWNENIEKVSENSTVQIENGYVKSYLGENQLDVGRYGKLTVT